MIRSNFSLPPPLFLLYYDYSSPFRVAFSILFCSVHSVLYYSQIEELRNFYDDSELLPGQEKFLNEVADEVESKISQILLECSSLSSLSHDDLYTLLGHLKQDLIEVECESANVESEIEELSRKCEDDCNKLENELEKLSCLSEFIESQNPEKAKDDMQIDVSYNTDDQAHFSNAHESKFMMLELSHQIEKRKSTLKSMHDLDSMFKRFEAVEKVVDALTGLRVIEIEENSIRLSLNTYIPFLENVLHQQNIEGLIQPLEFTHELIIETVNGTLELKNVEIFPNDVFIGEIVDAAKSYSHGTRSSLEWFVRRAQDRIALSSLRRFLVKNANNSRHSLEYLDKEDVIVGHVVGGIDAFIKLPQSWPLLDLPMELISLKNTSQNSKEISLSFLCKIVEMANSLTMRVRQNITNFTDSIEEMLMQQMHADLSS